MAAILKILLSLALVLARAWEKKQAEDAARRKIQAERDAENTATKDAVRGDLVDTSLSDRLRAELIELGKKQAAGK